MQARCADEFAGITLAHQQRQLIATQVAPSRFADIPFRFDDRGHRRGPRHPRVQFSKRLCYGAIELLPVTRHRRTKTKPWCEQFMR